MPLKTTRFDIAGHLKTPKDYTAYLEAALEDGDPGLVAAALGDIARARGISDVARQTGLSREGLYKSLSKDGDPRLSTLLNVTDALGFKVVMRPAAKPVKKLAKKRASRRKTSRVGV